MRSLTAFASMILNLLSIPIMIFNFASPIVAAIWLGYLGEWAIIGWGVAYMLLGTGAIGIALLPAMAIGAAAAMVGQRGNMALAIILAIPAMVWTLFLAGATCAYAMFYAANELDHEGSIVPYVLWAIAVATAPWDYMAMKETQASGETSDSMVTASLLNAGCIVAFIGVWLFNRTELLEVALPIGVAIMLAQLLNLTYAVVRSRARREFDF